MYDALGVKHEPLRLIAPQFETPFPPLQLAVSSFIYNHVADIELLSKIVIKEDFFNIHVAVVNVTAFTSYTPCDNFPFGIILRRNNTDSEKQNNGILLSGKHE